MQTTILLALALLAAASAFSPSIGARPRTWTARRMSDEPWFDDCRSTVNVDMETLSATYTQEMMPTLEARVKAAVGEQADGTCSAVARGQVHREAALALTSRALSRSGQVHRKVRCGEACHHVGR